MRPVLLLLTFAAAAHCVRAPVSPHPPPARAGAAVLDAPAFAAILLGRSALPGLLAQADFNTDGAIDGSDIQPWLCCQAVDNCIPALMPYAVIGPLQVGQGVLVKLSPLNTVPHVIGALPPGCAIQEGSFIGVPTPPITPPDPLPTPHWAFNFGVSFSDANAARRDSQQEWFLVEVRP